MEADLHIYADFPYRQSQKDFEQEGTNPYTCHVFVEPLQRPLWFQTKYLS